VKLVKQSDRSMSSIAMELGIDRESVREATSEYIEVLYNRIRRHSTIGHISPAKFEEMNQAEAA
jgi:putative transposase